MFTLKKSATFTWPVEVNIPTDGGKFHRETFDAEFRRKATSELQALQARIVSGELTDAALVTDIMVGWSGVTDDGEPVPFSHGALERLLEIPGTAAAIVHAFIQAQSGLARKN